MGLQCNGCNNKSKNQWERFYVEDDRDTIKYGKKKNRNKTSRSRGRMETVNNLYVSVVLESTRPVIYPKKTTSSFIRI
jgi:hypothetical protein